MVATNAVTNKVDEWKERAFMVNLTRNLGSLTIHELFVNPTTMGSRGRREPTVAGNPSNSTRIAPEHVELLGTAIGVPLRVDVLVLDAARRKANRSMVFRTAKLGSCTDRVGLRSESLRVGQVPTEGSEERIEKLPAWLGVVAVAGAPRCPRTPGATDWENEEISRRTITRMAPPQSRLDLGKAAPHHSEAERPECAASAGGYWYPGEQAQSLPRHPAILLECTTQSVR